MGENEQPMVSHGRGGMYPTNIHHQSRPTKDQTKLTMNCTGQGNIGHDSTQ